MLFEPLEPRLLLSAQPLSFAAAVAADLTLRLVDDVGTPTLELVDNGATTPDSRVVARQALVDTSAVEVEGSADADRLVIDDSVPVDLSVAFAGGHGLDELVGRRAPSLWRIAGRDAGQVDRVTFSEVENLTGAADNEDTFLFESAGEIGGVVDGGAGGFDTIALTGGWFQSVDYRATGLDSGTIARDGDLITYVGFEPIIDATGGPKTFAPVTPAGNDLIEVRDEGAAGDGRFAVRIDTAEDLIFTNAAAITSLAIDAGPGADRIVVGAPDSQFTGTLTVNAGDDDDTVVFAAPTPAASVTLSGGGGQDTIQFESTAAVTLTDTELRLDAQAAGTGTTIALFDRAVIEGATLNSAGFTSGPVIFAAGVPDWVSQGPASFKGGQVRIPPDNPVAGAIEEVAIRPHDLASMYIGTVGGGVWRNSDSSVLFKTDDRTLDDADDADGDVVAKARLDVFAEFLKANPTLAVSIVGHTDNVPGPTPDYNQVLSQDRALAVKNYLIGKGIAAGRLTNSGVADTQPMANIMTEAGRALNRRVELVVNHWVPLTDHFPSLSISALAISPLDADGNAVDGATPTSKLVIYAGTGTPSSASGMFDAAGAPSKIGILRSMDGGATWELVGKELAGSSIQAIEVLLNGDVLVGTNGRGPSGGGLFRSIDNAEEFDDIVALTDGTQTPFPKGSVDDIEVDPGNPMQRAYASVAGQGVFISTDSGAGWGPVITGLGEMRYARRIMLAVSPSPDGANHPVYAATIGRAQRLTAVGNLDALTIQVAANTVLQAGDVIAIFASGDGLDNDGSGVPDDDSEDSLRETWRIETVGAIAGGNRTITLEAADGDDLDNDDDGTVDDGSETGRANNGLFRLWELGANIGQESDSDLRVSGLFRSDDLGASWTPVAQPGRNTGAGGTNFEGPTTSAQANQHFSIAVDPLDPDVVFIGGDTQNTLPAGATFSAGHLLRGDTDAGTWQLITDGGANNTAPHADSRDMVFRGLHVVQVDDGGIYELRNASPGTRVWRSLNADLTLAEVYSLAFDPFNNVITAGTQDNGTPRQSAPGSTSWDSVLRGDGAIVQASGDLVYFSRQELRDFSLGTPIVAAVAQNDRFFIISPGTPFVVGDVVSLLGTEGLIESIDQQPDLNLKVTVDVGLPAAATGTIALFEPDLLVNRPAPDGSIKLDLDFDATIQFANPVALNAVDDSRLLFGTNSVYESQDNGRSLTRLRSTGAGVTATDNFGQVTPLVYGGREPDGMGGFIVRPDIIYVGTDTSVGSPPNDYSLWFRDATGGFGDALTPIKSYSEEIGKAIADVAIDPDDWHKVYVLDMEGEIWFSPNAGQAQVFQNNTAAWKRMSGGLDALPGARLLQEIAVETVGGTTVLLASGQGGVYRKVGDAGAWHQYGEGLPNALATSLVDVVGPDDLLLAGTFGRGAWALPNKSQTLAVPGALSLTGTAADDVFVLRRNAKQPWLLDVFQFLKNEPEPTTPSFSVQFSNLSSIAIDGKGGSDRYVLDYASGGISARPIVIADTGLAGTDELRLLPTNDPDLLVFDGGGVQGTPASGSHLGVIEDVFGHVTLIELTWTGLDAPIDDQLVVQPSAGVAAKGLGLFADRFGASMSEAIDDVDLPGIGSRSLAAALNGVIVDRVRPKDLPFVEVSQVRGSDTTQIDNGKSILLRLLEAGGVDLGFVGAGGTITDPAALELALENLDGDPNNNSAQITPDPYVSGNFEISFAATDTVLEGVIDLEVLADAIGFAGNVALRGQLEVDMTVDLSLAFGVDADGFYIRTDGPVLPRLKVTELSVRGEAIGAGTFGFLGVDVESATLDLDDGVELVFTLTDPGTGGNDNRIRPDELLSLDDPGDLITFDAISDGDATADLVIEAQIGVSALIPGVEGGISLLDAGVKLSWASIDVSDQIAVSAAANAGADVAHFLQFLEFNAQDIVDRLTTLRDNLEALYGAEIPFLSDSVTEIVDLITAFQDKVLDPLAGGSSFEIPSIQALIRNLAVSLGITPDQLGLAYDTATKELTYHLVLSQEILNQTKALGAGVDLAGGLAELEFNTDATVSASVALDTILGVDLDHILGDPRDWFFLRNASATAQASISASDIEASARFGFLSIGIDEGTLTDIAGSGPATVSLTVSLTDPGAGGGQPDGRIDLREILDNLDNLGDLVDITGGGSLRLVLPVETSFLPGLPDIPDGGPVDPDKTIAVEIPDLGQPSSFQVILGPGLTEVGNFANIDAASIVGVLGQLTFWLDEFRRSDAFANLDVPLVGPALDEALQLADAFRDLVLIDDNDTLLDSDRTLLADLNAALDDAGLGRKLFAANVGGRIALVALDASITSFTVTGATALGFGASQDATVPAGKFFAEAVANGPFTPVDGTVGADVSFTITIGTKNHTVELEQSATDTNEAIGDDRWKLVNADNAPTFATAQQMAVRLLDAFGIGYPGLTYDPGADSLNFTLDLSQVFADLNLPFSFDLQELPDFLQLQTSGALALKLAGGVNLEVGVFLGNAEPSDKLQAGTLLADLSQPVALNNNQRYDAQPVVGKLTGDAHFSIAIDGGEAVPVTVTKLSADNNTTVADLVGDINAALLLTALAGRVQAQGVPGAGGLPAPPQIQFVGLTVATSLAVTATAGDPAVTDIGLPTSRTVTGVNPTLIAARTLPPLKGRLTADAGFRVELILGGSTTNLDVALTPAQTADNDFPFSIVNDIQAELDPAESRVKVGFSSGALTFSTLDGSAIAVSNVTGTATNELGIVAGIGNSHDVLITLRSGASHRVAFDSGDTTVQHIIDAIETATTVVGEPPTPRVTVAINAAGSGLDLTDHTTGGGTFKVQILNNSTAGLLLGIVRQDSTGAEGDAPDGLIEGADIAALTALDRFFVKATPVGVDPLAGLTVEIGTPVPLTASAKFGFVGLGLQGEGGLDPSTPTSNALQAALTVRLLEPAGSTDGRVSLAEMIDALDDLGSLFDFSLTGQAQLDLSLTAATIASLSGLGIDVGAGPRIEIAADMTANVFDGHPPVFSVTTQGFDELDGFGNLDFNFQAIVAGLAALVDFLDDFEALSFLNDPIPVIDVSVKDLVGMVQQFADAVTAAQNDPAGTLQVLEDKLLAAFGLPANSPNLNLLLVDGPTPGSQVLKIDTQLTVGFSESLPINLDLGLDPLEFGGDADLSAQGSLRIDLDFGFDIANPLDLYIFDTTGIVATLDLAATDLDFKAAVGPLGVFVADGTAEIHGTLPPPNSDTVLTAGFQGAFAGSGGMATIGAIDFGSDLAVQIGGALDVTLPVYFPTESVRAGTVKLTGTLSYIGGELTANLTPSALDANGAPTTLGQLFTFDPGNLSLLDQLLLGVDGVDLFLEGLQDLLDGTIGGFELPLVGDKLSGAADAIGDFRDGFIEGLRQAIEDLANPALAFAEAGIAAAPGGAILAAAAPQGVDPVSKLLFRLLGPTGLGVVTSPADIVFDTNIQSESDPSKVFFDWDIHMAGVLANASAGIGFDLGIPGLGLETEGDITLAVDWALDLGFGINFEDGFYLDIADQSELELTARVTTPGLGVTGRLGFLQIEAHENVEAEEGAGAEAERGDTGLTVQFGVDILNRQNAADPRLGFAELGRIGVDAKIAGRALVDLQMALKLNSDLVADPGNFPSIVADFAFDWGLGTVDNPATPGDEFDGVSLSALNGGFLSNGLQFIGFDDVGLDLGKYFSDVIGPIVEKVQEVTEPIKPFLDFLTEPIPVISDLAGPTSLLDIAAMSGVVNPGIIKAIEIVDQVVDIVSDLNVAGGTTIFYVDEVLPDGALTIYQAPGAGLLAAAGGGIPNFDPSKPINLDNLKTFVAGLPDELGPLGDVLDAATDAFSDAVSKMRPGGGVDTGFALPIIEDPSQIFGMLLGQPADLVTFTMAPLELEAEFSAFFSILGPLGVSINAEFGAQFGPFTFGYDTFGITQFAASDFRNPLLLFDGLFVGDLDAQGNDVPELQFDAGLWAAAELNLGIARGGVGGGLFAEIDFNLYDPDDDGKVRIKELVTSIANEFKYGNPIVSPLAIFDISGKLTAELFAFLKIDLGFFEIDEKIQITDPIELLSFENVFERFPTLATELGDGVLQLNIGKNAAARIEGDLSDVGETIYVGQGSDASHVKVWAPQFGIGFSEAQEYLATSVIVAFGGEGDDHIHFSGPYDGNGTSVTSGVELEIYGDAGDDEIIGTGGTGAAFLVGGSGDDELTGGGGGDTLFGGTGLDTLRGGAGHDWLIGDGDHEEYLVGSVITIEIKASDAADELHGDAGEDLLIGAGGADMLRGGDDADVLIGDGGQVTVLGDRRVATTRELDGDPDTDDPGRLELAVTDTAQNGKGAADELHGEAGDDHLYGGFGNDTLTGGDDNDVIYGDLGADTADGGAGHDVVFGDSGVFTAVTVGDVTTLEPFAITGGEKDDLSGGAGNDKLLGGAGNDRLRGNEGDDVLWGGVGQDRLWGDNEDGSGTGHDKLYGEADSDELRGGMGDDYLEGGGGNDLALGGIGVDTLVAGYGSDTLDGEADGDTYRISVRGGPTTELSTAYDTGTSGVDSLVVVGTPGADTLLLRAMADSYFPTLGKLQDLITKFFNSTIADRLAAMVQAFGDAYGPWDPGHGLIQALTDEYQEGLHATLEAAVVANRTGDASEPTVAALSAIIADVLASGAASKLDAMQKAIGQAYAEAEVAVPMALFSALTAAYKRDDPGALADILVSIVDYYVAESLYPRVAGLQLIVDEVYADDEVAESDRLTAIKDRVGDAFGDAFASERDSMLAALQAAWDALPPAPTEAQQTAALKGAIAATYTPDPVDPDTFTNTAFVAVINDGGADVERFNYRRMEGLVVSTLGGDDDVVLDDLLAAATINLGAGDDRVQVGQVFRSERVKDPEGELITGIRAEDVFTTIEITRGWLSNGVSVATTINGDGGDDNFTVFHNVAVLNLNGNDGDDVFTVRAFALKGSTDNERARTDMKGDGGADTILYVVNAPVGIDGGDGLDTVRIVGTEFGDDFVVTDSGVFGAGLNVSYVNIERLVADGAEGDDRFFVMSTGLEVVTEIDGGLGSDTYFVGGNPAQAPVPVISNDLRGHSGIILHRVESVDAAWHGLAVEGLSANIGDDEEAMILLSESGGRSLVVEGAVGPALGATDTYRLRLSRPPQPGTKVVLAVVPAGLSPEDQVKNFANLEVSSNGGGTWSDALEIELDGTNWSSGVEIMFRARLDVGDEGRRFTFLNHKITEQTTDATFLGAQTRSLKVQMEDDDRDGVIVVPSGLDNTVLEDGFTDAFDVVLSRAPTHNVTVTLTLAGAPGQVLLNGGAAATLTFTPGNWDLPKTVTVSAVNDGTVEGFHTEYLRFEVSSADGDETKGPFAAGQVVTVNGTAVVAVEDPITHKVWLQVDGDIDDPGIQEISGNEPSTFVLLPHRPIAGSVAVRVAGAELAPDRFSVTGNTVTFLAASGAPEFLSGKVEVNYQYTEVGYDGSEVRDQVVDIYDNDTPTVIVRPAGDGMIDVVENDPSATDTYTVRLASQPTGIVNVVIDSVKTRTTWGANVYFEKQALLTDSDETDQERITLTFTPGDWNVDQVVTVRALDDTRLDGNDTQVFAPDLQTVNKIRGPLIVEGAAGAGSLTLPAPLMMPWELNVRQSDGNVVAFQAADSPAEAEAMTVELGDLEDVVDRFKEDDPTFVLAKLVGKTLEMSKGAGTDIVLDPNRPDDTFDRFWLITDVEEIADDGDVNTPRLVVLTLQNPTAVDPTRPNVIAPDADSEYAITSLSVNFFADEREQIDYLFVFDNDSVADDAGALTSADGVVLGFDADTSEMTVETSALQRTADLLGLSDLQQLEGRQLAITVGPGTGHVYTIEDVSEAEGDTKVLTLASVSGSGQPTSRSEFRIEGSDRYGRITGFGMGPNVLFAGRPQGGGITYGDLEVVQVSLGSGDDAVRVDYATNAEDHATTRSGDFYTLTVLDTGTGDDEVVIDLHAADDGAFALNLQSGDDTADGSTSTAPLVIFGWDGADDMAGGAGDDIVFGDRGRVDYVKTVEVETDNDGEPDTLVDEIVTRFGHSVAANPVNPPVTGATATTLSDAHTTFEIAQGGLVGLSVQAISPEGHVQFRTIVANDQHTVTVDRPWDALPVFNDPDPENNSFYRISNYPEDQTDGVFRNPRVIWTIDPAVGGTDTITGGGGADLVMGGARGDSLDGDAGNDLIFGDAVQLGGRADADDITDPRFQALMGSQIYGTPASNVAGADQVDGTAQSYRNPDGSNAPWWAHVQIRDLYHTAALEAVPDDSVGNDYIAGGGHHDVIFGQLGDDTIQGDGSIEFASTGTYAAIGTRVGASRDPSNALLLNPSVEASTDGDDYIEGNGGHDVVFGGLGQDDIIGGSSDLFTLDLYSERPDGSDLIFGGAGTDAGRNDPGSPNGTLANQIHARDADVILGDNGDIFRLVGIDRTDTGFLTFNYDLTSAAEDRGTLRIIPRAARLLDYTPGGPDFTQAVELAPADVAVNDIGAADELHGEGGDDVIYGMVGNDVLFGDGQDDSMVGGYGADWMSGGTGDDGMIGDDGRVFASRNSTSIGEPLYGIAAIAEADINRLVSNSNGTIVALTNMEGVLKYTVDLTPFSLDPTNAAPSTLMPRPLYANDIIYGGLGHDALHGGAGEDAISGAEAPAESYTNTYDQAGTQLNAAPIPSDFLHPVNPGNVLGYAPTGPNATKFALYDANDPLRKIRLTETGALSKTGPGLEWLLNFDETEGPIDTAWIVGTAYPGVNTDGDDHLFGDLGHDWLVGGSGRDTMWAGWGDDLTNADDKLTTNGGLNSGPDTNPSWEDFAFGGAGRDVLVANTGGDRLVDWTGEFNTFVVPYNPFGLPTVSRLFQPALEAFMYALAKSQGADPTLAAQYGGDPARHGEPFGELGLVRQGDAAFGNQTGGPRDPQGPNSNAKQDVNPGAGVQPLDARAVDLDTVTAAVPSQLAPIVAQAKLLWARALGPDDRRLAALDDVQVLFGNLPRGELAVTVGNLILIDSDAAGRGWFIDPTPGQSEEFTDHRNGKGLRAPNSSPAFRRMDLLTTVAHELGHALGFQEVKAPGHVMAERLPPGERRLEFDALPVRMGAEPLSVTGSTNGVGRGFDVPEMRVDRTPRQNGARPMVDWDLGIDGVLTSLSPHGDERVKSALKPLVPAFTDGGSEGWTTDRRAGARRSGAAAAEHEETRDAVRLPSPGWEWRVEVGAARSRVSTSEREQIL